MKIGIDASRAFLKKRTGIEEYAYQVIRHLAETLKEEEVFLYVKKNQIVRVKESGFTLPSGWRLQVIGWPYLWTQVGLSLEMWRRPADILLVPAHVVPIIHPRKTVVVVHGLEYEFCPGAYSFWERLYMRWSICNSCCWASKIVAVSKNTKKDLINLYKIPAEKIKVVYEGCVFKLKSREEKTAAQFLPQLLFIGRLEERKNIVGIVRAFEILKKKDGIPHQLILSGKPGYGYEKIKKTIEDSEFRKDILETGYVSEERKRDLLRQAETFLFPTQYEGFGLPVLEAQAFGVPVVVSDNSSLPEVAGAGAVLVDWKDPENIAEAVREILFNSKKKEDLIKAGYINLKNFSWEKCAREISDILR